MTADSQLVVTSPNTPVSIQLTGNALTGDEDYFITWYPMNGEITGFNSETGTLTYTPFEGTTSDQFKFVTIRWVPFLGWFHSEEEGTVTIIVTQSAFHTPSGEFYETVRAFDRHITTNANEEVQIELYGDTLTIDFEYFIMLEPTNGTITDFDSLTGVVTYKPTVQGATTDMFTYTIFGECDVFIVCSLIGHFGDTLHGNQATVTITINPEYCGEFDTDNDGIGNECDDTPYGVGGSLNPGVAQFYADKISDKIQEIKHNLPIDDPNNTTTVNLNDLIPEDNLSGTVLPNGETLQYTTLADLQPYISPTLAWAFYLAGIDWNSLSDAQKAWLYAQVILIP